MKLSSSLCLFSIQLLMASCIQEGLMNDDGNTGSKGKAPIDFVSQATTTFNPSVSSTRAALARQTDIVTFGVSASFYPNTDTYSDAGCGSYFHDIVVNADDGVSGYYWPGLDYRLSFFAYTPCDNPLFTISSEPEKEGMPEYQYSVPASIDEQIDIMTCNVLDHVGLSRDPVPLVFNHKCSDVRFSVLNNSSETLSLKRISLTGMKYKGTLQNDNWVLLGAVNSPEENPFILEYDNDIEPDEAIDVTGTQNHFIVLPQTVPAGTRMLTVITTELGEEQEYTYILPDAFSFNPGFSYNFNLTLGFGKLTVNNVTISQWEDNLVIDGDLEIIDPELP